MLGDAGSRAVRRSAELGIAQPFGCLAEQLRVARDDPQMVELCRRPAVVRCLTGGENEAADAVGVPSDGDLGVRSAGVVADQGDIGELEPLQDRGNEGGDSVGSEIGSLRHRPSMSAEGEIERQTPKVLMKRVDHRSPKVRVGQPAMDQDQRWSATAFEVLDRPLRQLQRLRLTEKWRPPPVRGVRSEGSSRLAHEVLPPVRGPTYPGYASQVRGMVQLLAARSAAGSATRASSGCRR